MTTLTFEKFPDCPDLPCQCPRASDGCVCIDSERALNAWAYNGYSVPMTQEQRLWCIPQIYNGPDPLMKPPPWRVANYSDRELAGAVLISWADQGRFLLACRPHSQNPSKDSQS